MRIRLYPLMFARFKLASWALLLSAFMGVLLVLGVSGCVIAPEVAGNELGKDGTPRWVTDGSTSLKTANKRLFHGVGSNELSAELPNPTLIADKRARAELSRVVSSFVEISVRNYIASGRANENQFTPQAVTKLVNDITNLNLDSVAIADHWRARKTHTVYAIAELDMRHVTASLDKVAGVPKGFKDFLRAQADTIFDQIARQSN